MLLMAALLVLVAVAATVTALLAGLREEALAVAVLVATAALAVGILLAVLGLVAEVKTMATTDITAPATAERENHDDV